MASDKFFSEEYLDQLNPQKQAEQGPVTVFGLTFKNDEERRQYFRDELRHRLPELRKIEGFPIGEDDDIINLSDPPYYTACPNPWLNDFIKQWEEEKKQLQLEGKRKADFEVKEPYAYGINQGKNSAIYNAHTYHTKVPHEVIMRYILHYTQPGDIVLDGFAGTGMTGVASSACELSSPLTKSEIEADFASNHLNKPQWGIRHSVCGDLSPLCFHISSNYNSTITPRALQDCVNDIIDKLIGRFGHFYEIPVLVGNKEIKAHVNYFVWSEIVACKNCGQELNVHDLSFDYTTKTLYKSLVCPKCGTSQQRTEASSIEETIYDEVASQPLSQLKYECCLLNYSIPKFGRGFSRAIPTPDYPEYKGFVPTDSLGDGDKYSDPKRVGANTINQLYYKRTKYVLAYLYDLIHNEYSHLIKPLMFIFTSMLPKLTRMNRYMPQHGSRALVGPMANTLYIPPQCVENNPIDQFEYQAKKVIRALEECKQGCAVQICSATNSSIENQSIDYVFTDPPFGSNIMYSELNVVSESWLKVFTNNNEEAISNKTQHKGLPEYQEIMTRCFREYYRVLKPGHWMTVEFSNTSASFWNSLQYSITNAGFIISAITDLNKERGGLHAMLGPTAVKQDLAISCYKPSERVINSMSGASNSIETVWDFIDEHLQHLPIHIESGNATTSIVERNHKILYDRLISYYVQHGYSIPMDSVVFQKGLKERFVERDGMFFTATQVVEYEKKKLSAPGFVPMGIMVSDEANGIEWLKNQLRDKPQTYQEIYPEFIKALNGVRKGDQIPGLDVLLEENFIQNENGTWRLANVDDDIDLEKLRTKALLKEFKLYLEVCRKPRGKLKDVRVEAVRAGFKQCYSDKNFADIILVGDRIPQNLLTEDEILLQYYDIASSKV
jgi:DNA modification methylase